MKPRASSCFPCASPSVRFYSNPGWGPNSRQALWRALHTHQMKDFHQATAASRRHTNVIFLLKGGDMLPLSAGLSATSRVTASRQRNPEQAWIMSDMFAGTEAGFCLFFSFFFFSLMKKNYNKIIDSHANCVAAPQNAASWCEVWRPLWEPTAADCSEPPQLLQEPRQKNEKKTITSSCSCDQATLWNEKPVAFQSKCRSNVINSFVHWAKRWKIFPLKKNFLSIENFFPVHQTTHVLRNNFCKD